MKIVCTDISSVSAGDINVSVFEKYGDVALYDVTPPELTSQRIADADMIIVNKTVIGRREIDSAPNLKYIGLFATGYNNIDTSAARERGIVVSNAGQYSTNAVAQHTFALILEAFSKTGFYNEFVKDGGWCASRIFTGFVGGTDELFGKTLGIIGFGSIGRAVAKIAESFGMKVVSYTRTPKDGGTVEFVTKEELFERSDVISFHCPLTPQTEKMLNKEALDLCRDGVYIINTSRGGVIDEGALADGLKSGKVKCAGLDVLAAEPMREDCPLYGLPNVIITPHVAWTPLATRERLMEVVTGNIEAYLSGEPTNVVN
ncbi:MAG: D-2-hydroxyacid dehydrogenase [Clostridia bacterium]|nr:D-2-hydroxyacid dehydrogenase [Clostridia bacterium]